MESITTFDHIFRVTALHDFPLEDIFCWELVIDYIEVDEGVTLVDDLLVHLRQLFCSLCCFYSGLLVTVEPAPAWTDF